MIAYVSLRQNCVRSTQSSPHYYFIIYANQTIARETCTTFTEFVLNLPSLNTLTLIHTERHTYTFAAASAKCFCHEEQYISLMGRIEFYLIFYLFDNFLFIFNERIVCVYNIIASFILCVLHSLLLLRSFPCRHSYSI